MTVHYVVEVIDHRNPELAGVPGCRYASPPQPTAQALALVNMLLGCPSRFPRAEDQPWHHPVAGGRRVIHLHAAADDGQLLIT